MSETPRRVKVINGSDWPIFVGLGVFYYVGTTKGFWWGVWYGVGWQVWVGYRLAEWLLRGA